MPVLKYAQSKLNVLPRRIVNIGDELEDALETVAKQPNSPHSKTTILPEKRSKETKIISSEQKIIVTEKKEQFVFVDVTERNHFRHKNHRLQKRFYSGKKKRHTVKNTILLDSKRRVIFMGRTFVGSTHDYKIFSRQKFFFKKLLPRNLFLKLVNSL